MDTDTFKEKFSFQLSGINLFVTTGITIVVLIVLTTVLIAFTPLREWIPGYTDAQAVEQTYENARRMDSLEHRLAEQEWMVRAMRAALSGEMPLNIPDSATAASGLQTMSKEYRRSHEDSLLRRDVEQYESLTIPPVPRKE